MTMEVNVKVGMLIEKYDGMMRFYRKGSDPKDGLEYFICKIDSRDARAFFDGSIMEKDVCSIGIEYNALRVVIK